MTLGFAGQSKTHRSQRFRNCTSLHTTATPISVYLKLHFNRYTAQGASHQSGHFDTGSTSTSLKRTQPSCQTPPTQQQTPISAEFSLHHAHHALLGLHWRYSTHLSNHTDYHQAWVQERLFIAKWMPSLNWPFISRRLRLNPDGPSPPFLLSAACQSPLWDNGRKPLPGFALEVLMSEGKGW